jgi:uncharacterized OB-fold protein
VGGKFELFQTGRSKGQKTTVTKTQIEKWRGEIPIRSLYTPGVGGEIFLRALKDRGELVGTACDSCQQVYLPARLFCERCFAELSKEVVVKPDGIVRSFTFCNVDHENTPLTQPLALALVELEGATTLLLHRLLGVSKPADVSIGSRVKVMIKPKAKRRGSILDIEGFRLVE